MWDALDIGSAPIQVLEPGCGTGNFMAGIPENIKANVSGVELDPISARIAAALNPDATILNADLADCTIHPGFDLTIGNVPYSGDISLDYRTTDGGTSRLPLHDYFIERSVDALRPGGVAMLLTSRYTLDKRSETMRADLARKAELVGAVRLPSSTFARQAGTEAVTDVLVLRRRERTLDRTPDEAWIHSTPIAVPGYQDVTVNVNQAVAGDMAAHAVGDIRPVIGRFGGDFDVVFQGDAEQVGDRLRELLTTQIAHGPALSLGEAEPAGRAEITVRPDHVAPFEYSVDQRGVVWYGDGTTVTEIAHGQGDEARRLRGMIRLRDLARELQRLELDPARVDDPDVEAKRAELDRAYDRFTSEFGRLCDRANQRAYSGEEYAYRWRKPGDPDRHIAYLSTAFDRDQAMKAREDAGYVVTKVDEDPAVLYEQHRKASCMRASHILERYESPDQDAVRILHGIVGEVNAHDPENDSATYLAYPSDKAVQIAGDGLTSADIAEKREMGGWNPRKDPLMRINAQGDWTGITQQQADQIVWDNRDEILTRASYDSELSTWTLHQLDQLKEPQPTQSLDRDRPEPDHKAPAQADSTTKRHGPRL